MKGEKMEPTTYEDNRAIKDYLDTLKKINKEMETLKNVRITLIDDKQLSNIDNSLKGFEDLSKFAKDFNNSMNDANDWAKNVVNLFSGTKTEKITSLVSLIAGLMGAISSISTKASEDLQGFYDEVDEAKQRYQDMKQMAEDTFLEELAGTSFASSQIGEIRKLINEGASDAAINTLLDDLIEKVPEVEKAVNKVNGKWVIQDELLNEILEKIEDQAVMTHLSTMYQGSVTNRMDAEADLDKVVAPIMAGNNEWDKAYVDYQIQLAKLNAKGAGIIPRQEMQRKEWH